jgi:hypothetical protein
MSQRFRSARVRPPVRRPPADAQAGRRLARTGVLAALVIVTLGCSVGAAVALTNSASNSAQSSTTPTTISNASHGATLHPGGSTNASGGFNAVSCGTAAACVVVGADSSANGAVATSSNSGASFQYVTVPASTPTLNAVSCTGSSVCVAVGGNDIIRSSNGGSSWASTQLSDAGISLLAVTCQGTTLCIAGGIDEGVADPTGEDLQMQAVAYSSSDGGQTWTQGSIPMGIAGIASVVCLTSTKCIAVGSNVLVSSNSGQTWTPVGVAGGTNQLFSISCSTSSDCVAVGSNPAGTFNPNLPGDAIVTTNGGSSFTAVKLPAATAAISDVSCASTCMAGGATGTGMSAPVFLTSSDGGSTWSAAQPPPGFGAVAGLFCPPSGSCVAVGSSGNGASATPTTALLAPKSGTWTPSPVGAGSSGT